MKDLFPKFSGDNEHRARRCALWTWVRLRKVDWDKESILRRAFRETPEQMVRNRSIFYMNPCSLQTITCALALKQNGFTPRVNVDIFKGKEGFAVPHFSIEIELSGRTHHIDFRTHHVIFNEGQSPVLERDTFKEHVKRVTIKSNQLRPDKTILELIQAHPVGKELEKNGYRFREHVEKLAHDAKTETFSAFNKRAQRTRKAHGIIRGPPRKRK